jgi:hypothetical protein
MNSLLEFIINLLNFLVTNPLTLLLTPTIWFGTTYLFEKWLGKVSLKTIGFCFIVAISATIGLIMLFR